MGTIWILSDCPRIACSFNLRELALFYNCQLEDQPVYNSSVYVALILCEFFIRLWQFKNHCVD